MALVGIVVIIATCIVDGTSGIFDSWQTVVTNERFVGLQQKVFIGTHIGVILLVYSVVHVTNASH